MSLYYINSKIEYIYLVILTNRDSRYDVHDAEVWQWTDLNDDLRSGYGAGGE